MLRLFLVSFALGVVVSGADALWGAPAPLILGVIGGVAAALVLRAHEARP